jgi:DNA-directed RNA polymerase subunit RPC12/RpoP
MSASDSFGEEFREIASCGGKIELLKQGEQVAMQVTGTGGLSYVQMGISLDGDRVMFWPMRGIDQRPSKEPSPMVPAFLPADKTGLWGRSCPKCQAYFRTDGIREYMFCPYCDCRGPAAAFTTENQHAFLNRQRELWKVAFEGGDNVTIDLDGIASELPKNQPSWTPKEEQQQFHFVCEQCNSAFDVLGEYASCPACGYRNSRIVFKRHWEELDAEFRRADADLQDRHDREKSWNSLLPRFISAFEAMADDLRAQLLKLPMTVKRLPTLLNCSKALCSSPHLRTGGISGKALVPFTR